MLKVSKYKIASTYASAWLDVAMELHLEDKVLQEVLLLQDFISGNAKLWSKVCSPANQEREPLHIIDETLKEIDFSAISHKILTLIAENNRLKLLSLICDDFLRLYYKSKGIVEVFVDTAVVLSDNQDQRLQSILKEKFKAPVKINYQIKPETLGGLAIRYNSFLIDDTIAGKLRHIKKMLLNGQIESN